jgi:hypothetical protein
LIGTGGALERVGDVAAAGLVRVGLSTATDQRALETSPPEWVGEEYGE